MTSRTKRILLIVGFILITLILAVILYLLFFQQIVTPPPVNIPPEVPPITGLPDVPPAFNIPIANVNINVPPDIPPDIPIITTPTQPGAAISPVASGGITSFEVLETNQTRNINLASNGRDLVYYDTQTGFFYNLTPDGQKQLFSDISFKNVNNVTWANDNSKAVLEYPDGSNIVHDFKTNRSITLPTQWEEFVFSNDNQQLAFKDMRLDVDNRYIAIANTNGAGYRKIEKMNDRAEFVHITWSPNDEYVALYRESIDGARSEVYPIGFDGENFRKFTVEGRDLRFVWSPSGNQLVYSVHNSNSNYKPTLWVVNSSPDLLATGRNKLEIDTWADKCTFSSGTTLYCAVPRNLDVGSGFSPSLANNTPDDLYKINIATGTKELVAQPLFPTTIEQIVVSEDGKYLYWLEKSTGQIKKMNL